MRLAQLESLGAASMSVRFPGSRLQAFFLSRNTFNADAEPVFVREVYSALDVRELAFLRPCARFSGSGGPCNLVSSRRNDEYGWCTLRCTSPILESGSFFLSVWSFLPLFALSRHLVCVPKNGSFSDVSNDTDQLIFANQILFELTRRDFLTVCSSVTHLHNLSRISHRTSHQYIFIFNQLELNNFQSEPLHLSMNAFFDGSRGTLY